jgi:hypothetical protein
MRILYILAIILIFACSGCATLQVDVDLYKDPIGLKSVDLTSAILKKDWFDKEKRSKLYNTFIENAKEKVLERNTKAYLRTKEKEGRAVAEADATNWANQDWVRIKELIDEEWKDVDQYAQRVRSAALKALESESAEDYDTLREVYDSYVKARPFSNFVAKVNKALKSELKASDIDGFTQIYESSQMASGIAASAELEGRYVGYPIFDPLISKISKNDTAWSNFVHTDFSANCGNAQFVLVREGLVVFHMKSLDFDPTPIIGAGAATAKLGLQIASAMASGYSSLPLSISKQSGGSTGDAASSSQSKASTTVNESEIQANRELLKSRLRVKAELLNALADLYDKVSDKNLDYVKKEFTSEINFYQGRVAAGKE